MSYNIDDAFQKLREVLATNASAQQKNLFQVVFHFWQFFYFFNQNMREADTYEKRVAIIDRFVTFYNELTKDQKEILDGARLTEKEVADAKVNENDIPLDLKESMQLLQTERKTFHKSFRLIAHERESREKKSIPKEKKTLLKSAPKSQKWVRT